MKLLLKMFFTLALTTAVVSGSGASAAAAALVSVDTASAKAGDAITLPVRLSGNDQKISAAIIPLKYNPAVLTFDSASFDPTFLPSGITGYYNNDIAAKQIRIVYVPNFNKIPMDTIIAASGILAFLHFHVAPGAGSQFSVVDSVNYDTILSISGPDTTHLSVQIEFADNTGTGIIHPGFEPGGVVVLVPTGVDDVEGGALPAEFALNQNYPNPFNPTTTISFDLPTAGNAKLEVFNLLGQSVRVLADGRFGAGSHQVTFAAENLPSGIYFYRLTNDNATLTRKMILLK